MDNPPTLCEEEVAQWRDDVASNVGLPNIGATSPQAFITMAQGAGEASATWYLARAEDDWTATAGSNPAVIEECCEDAENMLRSVNPRQYKMPAGTRLVCVKTSHLNNLYVAMKEGVWVFEETIGEKINQLFMDEDRLDDAKVLFMFSINKQKSFCALAEMTSPWTKCDSQPVPWQEERDNYKTVGIIGVTFTHVKNVANNHFEHIRHEGSQQPISNMWNGMHFQIDKGREAVKVYQEKAHFTNILCRDMRKSYHPLEGVVRVQDLDPGLARRSTPYYSNNGSTRNVGSPHASSNWRIGPASRSGEVTPTYAQTQKLIEPKTPSHLNAPLPTHQRSMRRHNVPAPLQLPNTPQRLQQAASPRPGQIIKCYVDPNGDYIPIGPIEGSSAGNPAALGPTSALMPEFSNHQHGIGDQRAPLSHNQIERSSASSFLRRGDSGHGSGFISDFEKYILNQQQDLAMSGTTVEGASLPSPYHNPSQAESLDNKAITSNATTTDIIRAAAMRPEHVNRDDRQPAGEDHGSGFSDAYRDAWHAMAEAGKAQAKAAANFSDMLNRMAAARFNQARMNLYNIARQAYELNQDFLAWDAMGSRASGSSSRHPEYQDWASDSHIEHLRIAPVSPFSREGDPFVVDSVSKHESPDSKALAASVNREIRTMRQGKRAGPTPPTPSKAKSSLALNTGASNSMGANDPRSLLRSNEATTQDDSTHGGVRLPASTKVENGSSQLGGGIGSLRYPPLQSRDTASPRVIPGLGHLPTTPTAGSAPAASHTFDAFYAGYAASASPNQHITIASSTQPTAPTNQPSRGDRNTHDAKDEGPLGDMNNDLIRFGS